MKNYKPMNTRLKELKNVQAENCITIILNTHRTFPNNEQDSLLLKNLIKEAESKLLETYPKKKADELVEKINNLANDIDHRYNLDSLVLFVNDDVAEFVRLAIEVEDRVVIGKRFAMRDLIRSLHSQKNYYVLVLSIDEARLIEASNEKVVKEFGFPFPFENRFAQNTYNAEPSDASRITNLTSEFFNQLDKVVNETYKNNPLPILISTDEQNYHDYLQNADNPAPIFPEFLTRSRQTQSAQAIVTDAWEIVQNISEKQNKERKADLQSAVSANRFLSDTNEIFNAIKQGRVQTLFVEENLFQPAVINNDTIEYVGSDLSESTDVIEDVYDELIDLNMDFGGDVVFLPKENLAKFNGFAAMTRY